MTEVAALLAVLAEPFLHPASRTFAPGLLLFGVVGLGIAWRRGARGRALWREGLGVSGWSGPSAALDVQLLLGNQLLTVLGVLPRIGVGFGLATAVARGLDALLGPPALPTPPTVLLVLGYSLALFVAWDASRYLLHRSMHQIPALWQLHQVHHAATALTPLTFHRVHPVEALLYGLRGALVTGLVAGLAFYLWRGAAQPLTLLGVDAMGLVLNLLFGNLRHSHVWLSFGPRIERHLLSPAQHQLHHGAARDESGANFGVWLACWDRWGGTLRLAEAPPAALGLARPNHRPHLLGALVDPLWAILRRPAALVGLLLPLGVARAEEEEDDPDAGFMEIIASEPARRRAVAGAVHEVDEAALEQAENDDIHRVLATVPGVYVRGEDGFGLRPNIGMRGASSDRSAKITLLEDGVPLSPAPYAAPAAYTFPLSTRLVGVEVYKGPAAITWGPQTIGGAVNLLTRPVPDHRTGAVDVGLGSFGARKAHAWGGGQWGAFGQLVEGAYLGSEGFKTLDTGGPTGFSRADVMSKSRLSLRGEAGGAHVLELKLGGGLETSDETYLGLTAEDFAATPYRRYAASAGDHMAWLHSQESLSWSARWQDRVALHAVAYHSYLDRTWTKLNGFSSGVSLHDLLMAEQTGQAAAYTAILRGDEDSASADQRLRVGTNDRRFHNGGLSVVGRRWIGGPRLDQLVEVGLRLHADEVWRTHTEAPFAMSGGSRAPAEGEVVTTLDSHTRARAVAVYVRDQLDAERLSIVPGLRVEQIWTAAGAPDAPLQADPTQTLLLPGLSASVGLTEALWVWAGLHRGASPVAPGSEGAVVPETAWNVETGLRAASAESLVEVGGFASRYKDLLAQCTLSAGCDSASPDAQYNAGRVDILGLESMARHAQDIGPVQLKGEVSYTFTQATFREDLLSGYPQWGVVAAGDALPYVPAHQGALGLTLLTARGSLGATAVHRGAMRDQAGQGVIPEAEAIPAATWVDLNGELRLYKGLRLYGLARNVGDTVILESYRPDGARPGAPRTLIAGLKLAPETK